MANIKIKLIFDLEELELIELCLMSYWNDSSHGVREKITEVKRKVEEGIGAIEKVIEGRKI